MEQQARVSRVYDDGTALVVCIRRSACSGDCHECGGCDTVNQKLTVRAENPQGAQPGEQVLLRSSTSSVLLAALLLYGLPLALFFLGYWAGASLWNAGAITGCIAALLGFGCAMIYDRRTAGKRGSGYTVYRYSQNINKGDNEFD